MHWKAGCMLFWENQNEFIQCLLCKRTSHFISASTIFEVLCHQLLHLQLKLNPPFQIFLVLQNSLRSCIIFGKKNSCVCLYCILPLIKSLERIWCYFVMLLVCLLADLELGHELMFIVCAKTEICFFFFFSFFCYFWNYLVSYWQVAIFFKGLMQPFLEVKVASKIIQNSDSTPCIMVQSK